ncbi:hypothetical protein L1887_28798 [Cichorium endivia]|nr:hypothetical protein L1887_28798 [Cichorium endivia]
MWWVMTEYYFVRYMIFLRKSGCPVGFSYAQVNLQQQRLKKKMKNLIQELPPPAADNSKQKKTLTDRKVHPAGALSSPVVYQQSVS